MEFYELNRLYDENLVNVTVSRTLDGYLYSLIPVFVSFGCGVSLVNIITLSSAHTYFTSKHYLYSQSVFTFLFQLVTSFILITNYYEKLLLNYYFSSAKQTYLSVKLVLNLIYNVVLYSIVWLFTIGALEFAFVSIKEFHLNVNFNKEYARTFADQLAHFNHIKKQLNTRLKRQLSVSSTYATASSLHRHTHHNSEPRDKFNSVNSFNSNLSRNIEDTVYHQQQQHATQTTPLQPILSQAQLQKLNTNNINPLILVNNYPDSQFNSYLDELNMFEFEADKKKKNKSKSVKSELDSSVRVFCSPKSIKYSIVVTFVCAVLLALPQMFAYEIKQSVIGVSPTKISTGYINSDNIKLYENIYFIREEIKEDKPVFHAADYNDKRDGSGVKERADKPLVAYTTNMARAYGLALEIDLNQSSVLTKLKSSYSSFFTLAGLFDVASKRYEMCNSIRNSEIYSPIRRPFNIYSLIASESQTNQTWDLKDVEILNLTLVCIRKGSWNSLLTYNTLYFWLEHTMVISVPFCIAVVVLISIVYTCLNDKKLTMKQAKTRNKMIKLHKIFVETSNLNRMQHQLMEQQQHHRLQQQQMRKQSLLEVISTDTNNPRVQETDILDIDEPIVMSSSSLKKKYRAKFVQIRDDLNETSPTDDVFESVGGFNDDLNFGDLGDSLEQQIEHEKQVKCKQTEHMLLNVMFIIDLCFYIVLSFPYTFMRLVLDLFVKDRIKINLDFYVLFKLTFLMFNLHLISKFFIMVVFSVKFRLCLCKVFAFKPSFCCIDERLIREEDDGDANANIINNRNNDFKRFCCFGSHVIYYNTNNGNIASNRTMSTKVKRRKSNDEDVYFDDYHSTEFNSSLHQYNHPSDPSDHMFGK